MSGRKPPVNRTPVQEVSRACALTLTVTVVSLLLIVGVAIRLVVGVKRRLAVQREKERHGYTPYTPPSNADIIDAEFVEMQEEEKHTFH